MELGFREEQRNGGGGGGETSQKWQWLNDILWLSFSW